MGGVFGSVATYTYIDSSQGKYCDKMDENAKSDEELYLDSLENKDNDQYFDSDNELDEENEEY